MLEGERPRIREKEFWNRGGSGDREIRIDGPAGQLGFRGGVKDGTKALGIGIEFNRP
jgi:hypothetical protein